MDVTLTGDQRMIREFLSLGLYMTSGRSDFPDHAQMADHAIRLSQSATGNVVIHVGYKPAVVARKVVKKRMP